MPTFSIESNGRIEKTAVYYNGEQLGGVKEVFLNLDEEGTFDAFIQYEGSDKNIYTKNIFTDYFDNVKIVEPSFSEEDSQALRLLTIDSNGDIEDTEVVINGQDEDGIVNLMVHIKPSKSNSGIKSFFSSKNVPEHSQFVSEITFRYEDDTIETESIFF